MPSASLRRGALALSAAAMLDFALQLLLPVALVRLLPASAFADVRLAWLAIGAAMAVAPLALPRSLVYLLPRCTPAQQGAHVRNTLLVLLATGAGAGLLLAPWNALLPASLRQIAGGAWFLPLFLPLWVAASVADTLFGARGEPGRQAALLVALACLRVAAVVLAARSGEAALVFGALLAFAACKLALLLVCVRRLYRAPRARLRRRALRSQLAYALPFGACSALFLLRGQADQWVAASVFSAAAFAAFSVGAVIMPLVALLRASVGNAIGARLARLDAQGARAAMLALNQRANLALAFVLLPALALTALLAEQLITLVYTATMLAAAPVLRVNCLALLGVAVEVSTLTMALNQGRFLLAIDAALLPAALGCAALGAWCWGLPGAALGNCVTLAAGNAVSLWRVARVTGVPLRRLQPWGALARILAAAGLAALAALPLARAPLAPAAGAALASAGYALAYLLLLAALGMLGQARALFAPAAAARFGMAGK